MRVLQINTVYKSGSTGRIAESLQRCLRSCNDDSLVAYGRGQYMNDKDGYRFANEYDILVHVLMTRLMDAHGMYSNRATNKLVNKIKEYNPDVIHLHNIHGYYMNYELLFNFLKETEIPVVWTLHDCWSFTGHCAYFTMKGCYKWQKGCSNCPEIKSYPKSVLFDNSKENYNRKKHVFNLLPKEQLTIVTPSTWLGELVRKSFLKKYNVKVIHNGINLQDFCIRQEKNENDSKICLLSVAYPWTERKGLIYLHKLAAALTNEYNIVIIGLNKKQRKSFTEKNVTALGRIESLEDLIGWYNKADCLINPTLEDNYPTVNLESIACGTPVITFPTGGSVESVINNETGWVTADSSLESLLEKIKLIKKKDKITANRCRSNATSFFDERKCFQEYINLYHSLVNG